LFHYVGNKGKCTRHLTVIYCVFSILLAPAGGNVPGSVIAQQIVVLSRDFALTRYTFTLAGVTRTVNPDWFNNVAPGNQQEAAMKQALRRGGPALLNVYSVGKVSGGDFLGYAAFPWDYSQKPVLDGVMIDFGVLPGGTYSQLNTGRILVHEVGRKCSSSPVHVWVMM